MPYLHERRQRIEIVLLQNVVDFLPRQKEDKSDYIEKLLLSEIAAIGEGKGRDFEKTVQPLLEAASASGWSLEDITWAFIQIMTWDEKRA